MNHAAKIYECEVMHQRLKPMQKPFSYRVFMLDVDLDDLSALAKRTRWLGHNRFNLFSIDDRDHVQLTTGEGIRGNLAAWCEKNGISMPAQAKVRLITFPRVLGYGFNPVSFYYISSSSGSPLFAIAEVVNTFREMKLYLVNEVTPGGVLHQRTSKDFYVSPFSDPADAFDFRLGVPDEKWQVNIDDLKGREKVLVSAIRGKARALTSLRLLGYAFKYPLLSLKIIGLIHWHALMLWIKRVPYFKKTDRRESQVDVLRPHSSLTKESP
jgi:DUF1365 family protein